MIGYCIVVLSICPSVSLCVRLSVCNAVHCGSQGRYTGLKLVPACSYSRQVPICPLGHFCCKRTRKKTKKRKRER